MNQIPSQNPEVKPEQTLQVMQILSGALGASVIMLGVVLFVTVKPVFNTQLFVENMRSPVNLVLFLMGFTVLLIRVPLSNTILAAALENSKPDSMKAVMPLYFTPLILRLALAEAGAMMGFVSSQMSGEATPYAILAAAALVAIVKEVPTMNKIKERVKALKPNIQL